MAATFTLLLSCNFELGHAVPGHQVLGRIDPGATEAFFDFTTRGSATFFTLAAFNEPVVPAESTVAVSIVDHARRTHVDAHMSGKSLERTNWDDPKASMLVYPMGAPGETLPRARRFSIRVRIEPPLRQPVVVVHHWLSEHGE